MGYHVDLSAAICDYISHSVGGRITFAEYMELALYHSEYGYYNQGVRIGFEGGDFFTSPHVSDDFGELLAVQFHQMWELLGKPAPFALVEMGAGEGLLAGQILRYLDSHYPDLFSVVDYLIVEKSEKLRGKQQEHLSGMPVRWCSWEEIPRGSIVGCFFSNELVDALPVHLFVWAGGNLQEVYVTADAGGEELFREVMGEPSTGRLAEYLDLVGVDLLRGGYEDGYRSEINLAALDWLGIVADCLRRGYVLTVDYGYPAHRFYHPRRGQGTLQCYYHHRYHGNPYINVGRQDITCHVDFTALELWGEGCGLRKVGFIQQGLFLMALGLGDRIATVAREDLPLAEVLSRRQALHQLIEPTELGGFGVLIQGKGLEEREFSLPLRGLTVPN